MGEKNQWINRYDEYVAPLATSRSLVSGFLHFLTCKFLMKLGEAAADYSEAASSYLNG